MRWLLVVVLVVAGAGFGVYYRTTHAETGPALATAAVTRGSVIETVEATGTLEAVTTVQVGTQVSGAIRSLRADFNSTVRKGQVIAELDPSLFETQVEQARATLARLEAEVERARVQVEDTRIKLARARELSAQALIPANDLETAEANARSAQASLKGAEAQVVQARASLNQSQVNLGHTVIRAPIDGVVISRNVDVGQTVAASMQAPTLFVLAKDLAEMQVNASIDESDIGRIQPGQPVEFRVDAYPEQVFAGRVSQVRLQPVVEQNVVSYVTVIDVPNPEQKLKPGMTATVTVEVARADDVLRVPNAALRFRPTAEVLAALGQELGTSQDAGSVPDAGAAERPLRANLTAEQREQMRQRFQQMSPEEREQLRQRFQGAGNGAARAGGGHRTGMTPVWVLDGGRLTRVGVRPGISDGAFTAVESEALAADAQVVTGLNAQKTAASTPAASSPLLPFGNRRFGRAGG